MLKKQRLKTRPACKVTFILPEGTQARTAYLVGDFNNWDQKALPMKKLKDGTFKAIVELEADREYQYRYLVNGSEWINDDAADRYVAHPYGGENSVVIT
jgi:1,4-alpha-glucan branching enzyme